MTGNPYAVLGVDEDADLARIVARRRELIRRHHPDSHRQPDRARMTRINLAYEQIATAERRQVTDARLARERRDRDTDSLRSDPGPPPNGAGARGPSGTSGWGEPEEAQATGYRQPTPSAGDYMGHVWRRARWRWRCHERRPHTWCGPPPRVRGFPRGLTWVVMCPDGTYHSEHHAPSPTTTRLRRLAVGVAALVWLVNAVSLWSAPVPAPFQHVDLLSIIVWATLAVIGHETLRRTKPRFIRYTAWWLLAAGLSGVTAAMASASTTAWQPSA
ncbi:MAG: DnaJ domain-containing protein [Egibacteraceae bacterium]